MKKLAVIFLLGAATPLFSQRYNFNNFSVGEGLVSSQVNRIAQDSRGYILFATAGGISSYNGKEFRNYSKSQGLPGTAVNNVISASDGNIWMACDEGLARFDGKKLSTFSEKQGLPHGNIYGLLEDRNGNIWAGSENGLFCLHGKGNGIIIEPIALNGGMKMSFYCLYEDHDGNIWAGTMRNGLFCFLFAKSSLLGNERIEKAFSGKAFVNKKECTILHFDNSNLLCGNNIRYIYQQPNGTLWISCWRSGITRITHDSSFSYKEKNMPLSTERIWAVQEDSKGYLWFATDGFGLNKIHKDSAFVAKNVQTYTVSNGLPSNHIFCIYADREENLWFGTYNGGAAELSDERFVHYLSGLSGVEKNVLSILQDRSGNYWLGTFGGGAYRLTGSDLKNYSWAQGISESGVSALAEADNGQLLFGTIGGGISILRPADTDRPGNIFSVLNKANGLSSDFITCLYKDSKGNIWVGTEDAELNLLIPKGNDFSIIKEVGFPSKYITSIFEDAAGNIWVGSDAGVSVLRKNSEKENYGTGYSIINPDNIIHGHVSCITQDKKGKIWLGTNGSGIVVYTSGDTGITRIAERDGLCSGQVVSLLRDADGNIWAGTNQGINKIVFDETGTVKSIVKYTKAEGFNSMECYANSVLKDRNGNIWFGTVNGATRYLRQSDNPNTIEPVIQLTGLRLNYKSIDWEQYRQTASFDSLSGWFGLPQHLVLPYYENRLTFDFIAASARFPKKIQYMYYLEGIDPGWNSPTQENYATYSSLPPGDYTFYLRAANSDGLWSKDFVAYHFTITPPFWKTKWFITLLVLAGIAAVYYIIKLRERRLVLLQRKLEQQVRWRTAEIVKQKEIIEQKNKHITQNITYAKKIQDAILPTGQIRRAFPESFILHKPKDIVSGDFYWFSEVRKNGSSVQVIAVADCTGHGVPGAFMSMIGSDSLSQIVIEQGIVKPSEILASLNERVVTALQQNIQTEARDGMDIAVCAIDRKHGKIEFSGAHRPLYRIARGSKNVEELKADMRTIGGDTSANKTSFRNQEISFSEGDCFYLFTDGFADQFGGTEDEKFMTTNFKHLLAENHSRKMSEQQLILEAEIEKWRGEKEQLDDILVVGIRT